LELQHAAATLEALSLERVLSLREHELSDFIENAVEPMHKLGPSGVILWANKAELELLGYESAQYLGHLVTEFYAAGEASAEVLAKLTKGEILRDYPVQLRCKDGALKHVLIYSNPLWQENKLIHTRCTTRDVTVRNHLESELRQRLAELAAGDRRKDEFLAMLGHELRNPLAGIALAVNLLRSKEANDASLRLVGIIERQTEKLTRLVDDLLDVSRITQGRVDLCNEPIDLAALVSHSVEAARGHMEERRHSFTVVLPEASVQLIGDPLRLEQVLVNLLVNAAKYTPPEGKVSLTVELRPNVIEICVSDTGMGLSPELVERVFDLFHQAERSLGRAQGGLGIGLTLARQLVLLHGGTITAHSEGENLGSSFRVCLPRMATVDVPGAVRSDALVSEITRGATAMRILIVDDNIDAAETLTDLLSDDPAFSLRLAHDGPSALLAAQEFAPDIVLLDIGLPGMDGFEVARRLQQAGSKAAIIALTGYSNAKDRGQTTAAGFYAHLVKPIQIKALLALIAQVASAHAK